MEYSFFKKKKVVCTVTIFTLLLTLLFVNLKDGFVVRAESNNDTITVSDDLPEHIKDGAILHAWCWSFKTIKENIKDIADAGYVAVQTSPINQCRVGNNGDLKFTDQWWYQYQPINYKIGNYQLGTRDEFIEMCNEAHKYGVKVIVDVVINHMTSKWDEIDTAWQDESLFHGNTEISDWNNRYDVTQNALLSLWDLNTQSKEVQNKLKDYLSDCINCGADGFRYDAAKHIELPDDDGYSSDFWPTILNNETEFQYGEILQDKISRDSAYGALMSVTASNYGYKIRDAIANNNFNAENIQNYNINVASNSLVTWVESHDNFTSDTSTSGYSSWMNDWQLKMCWAVIAARSNETPLFFSRPVGGGNGIMFTEETQIGDKGSDLFKDKEVVAVNKFRNAMVGESEYLKNYQGNNCLIIERGNKGVVIINLGQEKNIDTDTNLAEGVYTDQVSGSIFTSSNGKLSGNVKSGNIAVLYKNKLKDTAKVYFKKPRDWNNPKIYVYDNSSEGLKELAAWPGIQMTYEGDAIYSYTLPENYDKAKVIFNDDNSQIPEANKEGLEVIKGEKMIYDNGTFGEYKGSKLEVKDFSSNVESPQSLGKEIILSAKATGGEGQLEYKFSISNGISNIKVLNDYSTVSQINWIAESPGRYMLLVSVKDEEGNEISKQMEFEITEKPENTSIIYFKKPSNWNKARIYIYDDSGNELKVKSQWPGEEMKYVSEDLYMYVLPNEFENAKVLFNDGDKQIPAENEEGFTIKYGEIRIYDNGNWS